MIPPTRSRLPTVRRLEHARRMLATVPRPAGNSTEIKFEEIGSNRIFTLDRPKALNALSWNMMVTLLNKADEWREDPNVKMVLGLGEGRAFAAGGDIKSVVQNARDDPQSAKAQSMVADSFRMNWKMAHLGKPYVAFIDGITMGGGAGLALPADIRIATERTIFAMPEQRIGYSPDFGGSYFMNQLDGQIGTWLAVTGRDVYGREAYELGIASHYVAAKDVPEIKERLARLESPAAEHVSALVAEYHVPASEGVSSQTNPNGRSELTPEIRAFLDDTFACQSLEAVYNRLKEAKGSTEVEQWAKEQLAMIDTRGPTGMAVAIENYHSAARAKRYATTLEQDILMGTGFIAADRATNDLVVGAVHTLFEKNKGPIPFEPPITRLDAAFLQPDAIRRNFFRRDSPFLVDAPVMDPDGLVPRPQATDSNWGKFRRYGIPSVEMVRAQSGTEDEVVSRLAGSEKGERRDEFEAHVRRLYRIVA